MPSDTRHCVNRLGLLYYAAGDLESKEAALEGGDRVHEQSPPDLRYSTSVYMPKSINQCNKNMFRALFIQLLNPE
jgi:hypothetical protein